MSKSFFGQAGALFIHPTYTPNLRLKITYYETLSLLHSQYDNYLYDFRCRNIRPSGLAPSASPFDFTPYAGGIMRFIYGGNEVFNYYGALNRVRMFNNWVLPLSAPSSPEAGSHYFDTATNKLYIYNGASWVSTTLS